jgi:SNF family Na+-dependent transporter
MLVVYALLALVGVGGTWWFNLQPMETGYLEGWFANPASSSAAVDVIVVALVVCLFVVVEGRRLGMSRWTWLLLPLTFGVAVAFTFPAFLAWREVHLRRGVTTGPTPRPVTA